MDLAQPTTLTDAAATVVAVSLWNHENAVEIIRTQYSNRNFDDGWDQWQKEIRIKIMGHIRALPLTNPTKECLLNCSLLIGQQMKDWLENHNFLTISSEIIMTLFSWKPKFILNSIEMAKRVILYENNPLNSFRMACDNCIEDMIFKLWPTVSYYFEKDANSYMEKFEVRFWITYFKHNMENLMEEMDYIGNKDSYQFAYTTAVLHNSLPFAEYFLKKMPTEQASTLLINTLIYILEAPKPYNYKAITFFLHRLSDTEQDSLIRNYPETILIQFLKYPFSGQLQEIASKTWSYLTKEAFYHITETIALHLSTGLANGVFTNIFIDFWKNGLSEWKEYVIVKCIEGSFLIRLALLNNTACVIQAIIQSSTSVQRRQIVFSYNGILYFDSLIRKNKMGCLSMSIQEFSHLEERRSWIDNLISTYKDIYSLNRFLPAFDEEYFAKLINLLEMEKNKMCP